MSLIEQLLQGANDSREAVRELQAEVATLRAQMKSPKPKRTVIQASLISLQHILEGTAGELLASHLPQALALVTGLIASLPS